MVVLSCPGRVRRPSRVRRRAGVGRRGGVRRLISSLVLRAGSA